MASRADSVLWSFVEHKISLRSAVELFSATATVLATSVVFWLELHLSNFISLLCLVAPAQ